MTSRRVAGALSVAVPVVAAAATWRRLPQAWFYADDFLHLFDIVTLDPWRFVTQIWGGHLYLVRNAIFLGLFDLAGPDPRVFFWTMLLTHLANVVLLHRVLRQATGDAALAGAGAVLWGTCPTLEGTLGWYSVYGQVLLTTLVLAVLVQLARTVTTGARLSARRALAWGVLVALGGACFGSGLGVAAAFPVAAALAVPRARRTPAALAAIVATSVAILVVYAAVRVHGAAFVDPRARALLSPAALFAELPRAGVFAVQLLAFGAHALVFGFLPVTFGHRAVLALGGAVLAASAVAGWRLPDRATRRLLLASWLLLLAAYATVAVGRSTSLELLAIPAGNAAAWPRYHYLGLALLTVVATAALRGVRFRGERIGRAAPALAAAWAVVRLGLLAVRPPAIDLHPLARAETLRALDAIRRTVAATPPGGVATVTNQPFGSALVPWLFPGRAGVFVIFFPGNVVDGRTVRFSAGAADWALAQARGGRVAELVERQ